MVTTVPRAPHRALTATARLAAARMAALLVLSVLVVGIPFPVAASVQAGSANGAVPAHRLLLPGPDRAAGPGTAAPRARAADTPDLHTLAPGPPASTCDQRPTLRDTSEVDRPHTFDAAGWDAPGWRVPAPRAATPGTPTDETSLPQGRAPPPTAWFSDHPLAGVTPDSHHAQ